MIFAFLGAIAVRYGFLLKSFIKNFAKIVTNLKNFYNFVVKKHSGVFIIFLQYKFTKITAIFPNFQLIKFRRTHVKIA